MTHPKARKVSVRCLAVLTVTALALAWGGAGSADARGITLTHNNAQVTIDETATTTVPGINSLTIGGVNNLNQEWFWFRTGNMTREQALDGSTLVSSTQANARSWNGIYSDGQTWEIEVLLNLTGTTGNFMADLAETITIRNLTNSNLAFSFFEYTDWDLNGSSTDDSVTLVHANPLTGAAVVEQFGSNASSRTSIVSPTNISRYELGYYSTTRDKLTNATIDNLANAYPPPGNMTTLAGPGDLTWAAQWNLNLAARTSYIISKDKLVTIQPVPEPATLGLLLMLVPPALAARAWRRRARA
jgi:hypothetical protein